jgi:cytochrome c2
MHRKTILVAVFGAAAFLLVSCAPKPSAESITAGKTLAYSRCTTCHSSANFEKHRYNRGEWESVINRMMGHGAQFTAAEQGQIADFLTAKFGR